MKTAQQLAWLCTTFGVLKYGQVAYSEVVCGTIRFGVLHPSIRAGGDLRRIGFHSLYGIVARGFPISPLQSEGSLVVPRGVSYQSASVQGHLF